MHFNWEVNVVAVRMFVKREFARLGAGALARQRVSKRHQHENVSQLK